MIFAGDVAIAHSDRFAFLGFPARLLATPWCFNLEGAILASPGVVPWGVFNSTTWSASFEQFSVSALFLANNHIHDAAQGVEKTRRALSDAAILSFGAGLPEIAQRAATIHSGSHDYLLLGFGWSVIGCRPAGPNRPGVNALEGASVRRQVSAALARAEGARVVVVIHGNYEFERYPQPAHRKLAQQLVDLGAYAVVFHHPHIVGGVERYRGRTIAYSVGNWAFSFGRFFGGKLRFPEESFQQIALELRDGGDVVHHAHFKPPNSVHYISMESVDAEDFSLSPEFEGMSHEEYLSWFKVNRLKKIALPIYKDPDASISNYLRDGWVFSRQVGVELMGKLKLKPMRRPLP